MKGPCGDDGNVLYHSCGSDRYTDSWNKTAWT